MPGLEIEDFYESDSSGDEENHSRLLSSVSQLDSTQRVKPAQRKEVASEVSEYNLSQGVSSRKDVVNVHDLAQVLGKKSEHGLVSKNFKRVSQKSKTLPKPLEKPTEERLKRSIGFENVKKQLRRWDSIVTRNAMSDRLCFPLNDNSLKMQRSSEFLSQFKSKTPLEEEISKVLKEDNKKLEEEVADEFPLTLEEMLEKRKEMAQLRAKLSYKQSKAQRQSRIKSKKYHRLLKREKIKQQLKEFEILQKTDPEAALKKLSELDKTRAQERASLRHRNTGKWAKNLTVRAKYDVETRKVLAEQLRVSRDLTQKVAQLDNSESETEEAGEKVLPVQPPPAADTFENPWTLEVSKEVQDFVSGYKKFWSEKNKDTAEEKSTPQAKSEDDGDSKVSEKAKEIPPNAQKREKTETKAKPPPPTPPPPPPEKMKKSKVSPKRKKTSVSIYPTSGVWLVTPVSKETVSEEAQKKGEDIDGLFDDLNEKLTRRAEKKAKNIKRTLERKKAGEKTRKRKYTDEESDLSLKNANAVQRPDMDGGLLEGGEEDAGRSEPLADGKSNGEESKTAPTIDPEKFIQVKPKRLRTYLPEGGEGDEEALDDEKEQQKMMEEAFGDDDVVAEFKEMKRKEEEEKKVELQTSLPGWGTWGGSGIAPKRKKRLMILRVPRKRAPKKDLIINENENPNLRSHLVKEVPHPFKSVEAFEASIRAPIGRDWVPETAHQKLIEKTVVTKLGTVIEPMSENEIVRLKKASKCPYKGKKTDENK